MPQRRNESVCTLTLATTPLRPQSLTHRRPLGRTGSKPAEAWTPPLGRADGPSRPLRSIPAPSASPREPAHGDTWELYWAAEGGGTVRAGQGLWLLTWRLRHVAAPRTEGAFPGSWWLLWSGSLYPPTARVPLLPELWGQVSATSEGKVGRPRSKSCQGWGARAGVRSSFFGKVGFGGREGRSGQVLPWACRLGGRTCCWPVPCSWES